MSTKNRNTLIEEIRGRFESLDLDNDLEFRTELLSNKFLNIAHLHMEENNLSRKQLAEMIGTSPSYITQLFNNTRIINLQTIAKLEMALGLRFEVDVDYQSELNEFTINKDDKSFNSNKDYTQKGSGLVHVKALEELDQVGVELNAQAQNNDDGNYEPKKIRPSYSSHFVNTNFIMAA
ncbi:MAG: helix-turn-helix transcriptional regulator [Saprospiraceae bacterium]